MSTIQICGFPQISLSIAILQTLQRCGAGKSTGLGFNTARGRCKIHIDGSLRMRIKQKQIYLRKSFLRSALFAFRLLSDISLPLLRLFGTKCAKCSRSVTKNDFVMRAKNQIYHIDCFRCIACSRQLVPGDEFALREDGLFCKEDNEIVEKATATAQAAHARGGQRSSSQSSGRLVCFYSLFLFRCGRSSRLVCKRIRI